MPQTPKLSETSHPPHTLNPTQNHEVWLEGEPAFIKIWTQRQATSRSAGALQSEEGFSQVGGLRA